MFKRHNVPATFLAFLFTILCLLFSAGTASAQTPQGAAAKQAFNPCDVLKEGGTVYDPSQCDELALNGMTFLRNKAGRGGSTLVMVAGKKSDWQLTTKSKKTGLSGIAVWLRRKADKSVVARSVTNAKGIVSLTIPSNLEGEVELVTAQSSMKQGTGDGNGDNEGFCFRLLPTERYYLCEIEEVDPPFNFCLRFRIVQVRPRRP